MKNQTLDKKFFRNNKLMEISAARMAHFQMITLFDEEIQNLLSEYSVQQLPKERKYKIEQEKKLITEIKNADMFVKFMRKDYDIVNREILAKKGVEMQDEIMPMLISRYLRSFQDEFIEVSAYILANVDNKYVEQLYAMYKDIRNPYAQALACLTIGVKDFKDKIQFLLEEYCRFTEDYPEENFAECPLFALYILHGKI